MGGSTGLDRVRVRVGPGWTGLERVGEGWTGLDRVGQGLGRGLSIDWAHLGTQIAHLP